MSEIDENQLVLYAQMANLVSLILQWPEAKINIKDIAVNFSKVSSLIICHEQTIFHVFQRPVSEIVS